VIHAPVSDNSSFLIDLWIYGLVMVAHPGGISKKNGVLANNTIPHCDMVWIPGEHVSHGSNTHCPEEQPVHNETVAGLWIEKDAITDERFSRFVEETKYVTWRSARPKPNEAEWEFAARGGIDGALPTLGESEFAPNGRTKWLTMGASVHSCFAWLR